MNRRMRLSLVMRPVTLCLAVGLIFCVTVKCNLNPSIPSKPPIPTSIPVGTQFDASPAFQTPPTSDIPDETLTVGKPLSASTPTQRKIASQPSPKPSLTPYGELAAGKLLPTLAVGDPVTITFIHMVTSESGWGVGNTGSLIDRILRTNDGGESWWDVSPPEAAPAEGEGKRAEVFSLDNVTAWAAYEPYEIIWFTKDGGKTWGESGTDYAGYVGAKLFILHCAGRPLAASFGKILSIQAIMMSCNPSIKLAWFLLTGIQVGLLETVGE